MSAAASLVVSAGADMTKEVPKPFGVLEKKLPLRGRCGDDEEGRLVMTVLCACDAASAAEVGRLFPPLLAASSGSRRFSWMFLKCC